MNKREAAAWLEVSERAVERYTAKGKLTPRYERGRTGPAPVFDRAQLEALKRDMDAPSVKRDMAAKSDKGNRRPQSEGNQGDKADTLALRSQFAPLLELLAQSDRFKPAPVSLADKLLLSVPEAAQLAGLSEHYLSGAIKRGELPARIIGKGRKIKRADLENFVAQM